MLFYLYIFICVFFFKQKTAYEMRISDWSSDVCSSDLVGIDARGDRVIIARAEVAIGAIALPFAAHDYRDLGVRLPLDEAVDDLQIGRASCRERVCQYV